MTALTVESDRAITGGVYRRVPSASGAKPFMGSAISYGSGGYCNTLTAGQRFAGFCVETIQDKDKASADGARYIDVIGGTFVAALSITVAVTDIGARVYATDDNAFTMTQAGASTYIGRIIGLDSSSRAIVLCQTHDVVGEYSYGLVAAGTAVSNTVTRTALASYTLKAGTLRAGSRIRVRGQAIATSTNSTDTWLLDIGGAVGGTPAALCSSSAIDAVNNDIGFFDLNIDIRTIGASGTLVVAGHYCKTPAALDTAVTKPFFLASTTIDTTADFVLGMYCTWSVASASNSARADQFDVDVRI
jgi:hypothetical protein